MARRPLDCEQIFFLDDDSSGAKKHLSASEVFAGFAASSDLALAAGSSHGVLPPALPAAHEKRSRLRIAPGDAIVHGTSRSSAATFEKISRRAPAQQGQPLAVTFDDIAQLFADQRGVFQIMPSGDQVIPARLFVRLDQSHRHLIQHGLFLWSESNQPSCHAQELNKWRGEMSRIKCQTSHTVGC